jgi:hypothetical protein
MFFGTNYLFLSKRVIKSVIVNIVIFCFLFQLTHAQNTIVGSVLNEINGSPIPNASVFINNTSIGTTADAKGEFLLNVPISGTFDLVTSSIGFESVVYNFNTKNLPLKIKFQLEAKVKEEQAVIVEPSEVASWEKWGSLFMREFIGQMKFADDVVIENKNVIKLRYYRKQNKLKAFADEPLVIRNKALGYTINYSLDYFEANIEANYVMYYGYPFFVDNSKLDDKKKWRLNRKHAFEGSLQHFMQSLYYNKLKEDGWQVRRMSKRSNEVKKYYAAKLKNYVKQLTKSNDDVIFEVNGSYNKIFGDSAEIIKKILNQPNEIVTFGQSLLTADSICTYIDSTSKSLYFNESLSIIYTPKEPEHNYHFMNKQVKGQASEIFLAEDKPIVIEKNGNFNPFLNVVLLGYFGWREKLAMLIPLDENVNAIE